MGAFSLLVVRFADLVEKSYLLQMVNIADALRSAEAGQVHHGRVGGETILPAATVGEVKKYLADAQRRPSFEHRGPSLDPDFKGEIFWIYSEAGQGSG